MFFHGSFFLSTLLTECIQACTHLLTGHLLPCTDALPAFAPHSSPPLSSPFDGHSENTIISMAEDPGEFTGGFIIWKDNVLGCTWNWICRHCGNLWKFLFSSYEPVMLCSWSSCSQPLALCCLFCFNLKVLVTCFCLFVCLFGFDFCTFLWLTCPSFPPWP